MTSNNTEALSPQLGGDSDLINIAIQLLREATLYKLFATASSLTNLGSDV